MEKYKIEKDSVQEIPIRFLVASVSRWQKAGRRTYVPPEHPDRLYRKPLR